MSYLNRLGNSKNPYQGNSKKVLCVCSAGLLRSPTLAKILSQEPYNYNTRAVGASKEYALIFLDEVLINWSDEIVFVNLDNLQEALNYFEDSLKQHKNIKVLDITDSYPYGDETLIKLLKEEYDKSKTYYLTDSFD